MRPIAITNSVRLEIVNPALDGPVPPADHPAWKLRPPLGLGDWVEGWAKPIARKIDQATRSLHRWARRSAKHTGLKSTLGLYYLRYGPAPTHIDGCSACSRRRRMFNYWLPDLASIRAWLGLPVRLARSVHTLFRRPAGPLPLRR